MAKEELPAISDDTKEMIEQQVKKGKARKFFLIYKGANIKTLVVFRKGPFGNKIVKSKQAGFKGDVAYGVVTGSGQKLFFQLPSSGEVAAAMKVDAWQEKPPTKKAKLRDFLNDNGLAFKPTYHMISELAHAPDPESDSDLPAAPPPEGSEVADEGDDGDGATATPPSATTESTSPQSEAPEKESLELESPERESEQPAKGVASSSDSDAAAFTDRLKALKPDLAKVVAAQLTVSSELKLRAGEAAERARKGNFADAHEALGQAEQLVREGLRELASKAERNRADSDAFAGRLKELLPRIKGAAGTPAGDEAAARAREAGESARAKDYERANALLDEAEAELNRPTTADVAQGEWERRIAEIEPSYARSLDANPEAADKMRVVMAYAKEQAEAGQYQKALAALKRLEPMLAVTTDKAAPVSKDDASAAALRTFRQNWDSARNQWQSCVETVDEQLNRVRSAMLQIGTPEMLAIADRGLPAVTGNHKTPVMAAVQEVTAASPDRMKASVVKVQSAVEAFRRHVATDPRVQVLDSESKTAFGVQLTIRTEIEKGLDALQAAIQPVLNG